MVSRLLLNSRKGIEDQYPEFFVASTYVGSSILFLLRGLLRKQAWGVLKIRSQMSPFERILILERKLNRLNHVHICDVSAQLCCGDTCQIWTWCLIGNQCVGGSEKWREYGIVLVFSWRSRRFQWTWLGVNRPSGCGVTASVRPGRDGWAGGYNSTCSLQWRHNEHGLKSLASRVFTQPFIHALVKENIKAPRHWSLWGAFTGDRWIPRTKGQ